MRPKDRARSGAAASVAARGVAATALGVVIAALPVGAAELDGSIGAVAVVDSRAGIVVRTGAGSDTRSIRFVNNTPYPLSAIQDQRAMFSLDAGERRATPCTRPVYAEIYRDGWLVFAREVACGQTLVLSRLRADSR